MANNQAQKNPMCGGNYMERNDFPLNVQSFVPFALSQQQLALQRQQQQQQQQQQQDQSRTNKFRLSQLNLARELQQQIALNDHNSNDDDDVIFGKKYFYRNQGF